MPASSLSSGAKRSRDESGENDNLRASQFSASSSSHAAIIEITHGMTRSAAAEYDKQSLGSTVPWRDTDALLNSPSFREKTCRFLASRADGVKPDGPVEMGVVQLLANDGKTLLFTSDAITPVNISAADGNRVCIGDMVLFQRFTSDAQEENGNTFVPAMVEFVALDSSALTDEADWSHAVSWNAVTMANWMRRLLSVPPGLAQLTCIMDSIWGDVGASVTVADAWLRSLQLPVFVQQLKNLDGVELRKVQQVKKLVFSMLRLYVAILGNADAISTLSSTVEGIVYQFLGSPLFVEGLSSVLPQLTGNVSESTWASAQQTMLEAMKFALRYVCREVVEEEGKVQREAREHAERGFLTVLHRISALWLTHEKRASQSGMQAVMKLVEEMARIGVFRRAAQWMRHKERLAETVSLVDKVHRPPTLQDIKDLHGLKESSLREVMVAMNQTYTPYLRQEALRFVECAMLAAYAELYGPVACAVSSYMESIAKKRADDGDQGNMMKPLHVTQVSQSSLRFDLSEYSLEEVRLHVLFGLPLFVTLRVTSEMSAPSRYLLEAHSCFGCIVVMLNGKTFVFPVILCGVVDKTEEESAIIATAYVLRDRDVLPSLVAASAASSSEHQGIPEAWLFFDSRHVEKESGDDDVDDDDDLPVDHLGRKTPRFLPLGTSAVSYFLYILHLQKLRAQMRQEELNSLTAMGRVKGGQGKGDSANKGGVLWWGGGSSGVAGDMFTQTSFLTGENEVLQRCLSDIAEATFLTASQVECLHTLTTAGPGLRTLVGTVGSGKTTLMHASSLSRGRMQEALRKQHQPLWHATIKHSAQTLYTRLEELAAAEDMEDLFKASDGSSARDLPEEVTNAALGHIQEHVYLSEKLRHCHTPMLLRPKAFKQTIPLHSARVLQEENIAQQFCSIENIMKQSHQRSLNAPLAAVLNTHLKRLKRLGDLLDTIARSLEEIVVPEEGEWKLFIEFLPWIMSKKERMDTFTEARGKGKTWETYLSEDLWDASTLLRSTDFDCTPKETVWKSMGPAAGAFHAVSLPNASRSLCQYTPAEAAGWRAVFWEKQRDLLSFLQQEIMDEGRHVFLLFLDLIQALAATSQTSKATVVTATGRTLLREIPFLRTWQPHYLVVDDYDQICDSLYLTLSSVTSAIVSHQSDSSFQHEQRLPVVILRALQRELQGTPLLSTVVLSESFRSTNAEIHKAAQLCRNASVAFYTPLPLGVAGNKKGTNNVVVVEGGGGGGNNNGDGQRMRKHAALTGFSSPCCVEFWTHAVALSAAVACDGVAAAFVRNRLREFEASMKVTVYCGFVKDKAVILEGMMSGSDVDATENMGPVCTIPFDSDAFIERDEECDVAVLCLSGIARRLRRFSAVGRQQAWERLGADRSFVEQLEWWLWRTLSYVRLGVIFVGSREVFSFIEPLQRLERFVLQMREQRNFWLPPEAKGAALALRCPDHENFRQLALITYSDYGGCQVRVMGEKTCRSLCLAPYENCTNPSHACLRICHVSGRETGALAVEDDGDLSHSDCPFPCARVPPCGHMCVRRCGEPCSPCEFVGLQELSCGQRVVSGMSDAGPVQTIVHHFQRIRCGESPQLCEERVTLRCSRCGVKNPMLCHEVVARGGMERARLTELECAGCVALYNRVAREHDAAEITSTVPPTAGDLPLKSLPKAAQTRLQELQSITAKKAQLMLQKEALETIQGRQSSEFYQQQEIYNRMQKQQEEDAQAHRQRVQENIQKWKKTLKQKYAVQMTVNEAMDTEVPLMISEAIAEEEKQRSHLFV
ncbi:hypothetical protein MOQ_003600 [Trypanosoma cruzi marinkellei]|uniref:Uncharacterized protein n=1 Tax=Trypanosoma cruzi marinkellei TaxID=85056 RepID=K2MZT3_TRYCR|nr:hypothetical protein MOQ_003600 [Trypanosoma cruzi marinkellei]